MNSLRTFSTGLLVLCSFVCARVACASSLVGDIVDVGMYREDGTRLTGNGLDSSFTVLAGTDDTLYYRTIFTLNIDEAGLYVNYLDSPEQTSSPWAVGWADGTTLRIDSLDALSVFDISKFTVSTNMIGWEDALLVVQGNSISINWGGLYSEVWSDPDNPPSLCAYQPEHPWCLGIQQLSEDTYFYLEFNQAAIVPLPPSFPLLLSALMMVLPFTKFRSSVQSDA